MKNMFDGLDGRVGLLLQNLPRVGWEFKRQARECPVQGGADRDI